MYTSPVEYHRYNLEQMYRCIVVKFVFHAYGFPMIVSGQQAGPEQKQSNFLPEHVY
jgi:hypothetical protein